MVTNAALKPVETILLCLVLSLGVMLPVYAEEPWRPETAAAVGRALAIAEPSEGENSVASFGGVQVEVRPVVAAASPCDVTLPQRLPRVMSALVGDSARFNALEGLKARLAQLSESSYGVSTKNAGLEAAKNDPIITEGITGYAANSWSGTSGGTYGFGNQHTQLSTPNGQQSDMNAQRSTPFGGSDDGRPGEFPWYAFQMLYDPGSNPMEQVRAFATRRNEVYSTLSPLMAQLSTDPSFQGSRLAELMAGMNGTVDYENGLWRLPFTNIVVPGYDYSHAYQVLAQVRTASDFGAAMDRLKQDGYHFVGSYWDPSNPRVFTRRESYSRVQAQP